MLAGAMRRNLIAALLAFGLALHPAARVSAQDLAVDLELVLAIDVSGSIDAEEFKLQRQGYAAAFRDPRLLQAIHSGPLQRIAVTLVDWAGAEYQTISIGWTLIEDESSAEKFAEALLKAPRPFARWTSLSGAIDFSAPLFDNNSFAGARKVIDISGDGVNNSGRPAIPARDAAVARGITINGLILSGVTLDQVAPWRSLEEYFTKNVIGGQGAFVIVAENIADFRRAVLTKLIREVADLSPSEGMRLALRLADEAP
jgi:Protein of unknown function (DUF1194)